LYEYQRITVGKPDENEKFMEALKECIAIALQKA